MDVEDGLSRSFVHVKNGTVTGLVDSLLPRDLLRGLENPTQNKIVAFCQIVQRRNVFLWDHQHVCRRLRADIFEREHVRVFVYCLRRNVPGDDLAEQAIRHLGTLPHFPMPYRPLKLFISLILAVGTIRFALTVADLTYWARYASMTTVILIAIIFLSSKQTTPRQRLTISYASYCQKWCFGN